MPTRFILTLLLILLAAVIAAAAIFFLLNRTQPPAPPGPHGAAGTGSAQPLAPRLTLIAESITNAKAGRPLSADVYLNRALLRSLGKPVLRPQHYAAKRHCAPNWETNEWLSAERIRLFPNSV